MQDESVGTEALGITQEKTASQLLTNVFWTESRNAAVSKTSVTKGAGKVIDGPQLRDTTMPATSQHLKN